MKKEYKLIAPPYLVVSKDGKNIPSLSFPNNKNHALLKKEFGKGKVDKIISFFMQNKMSKYPEKVKGYTICEIQYHEFAKSGYTGTTFNNPFNILMFKKDDSGELIKFYTESDCYSKKLFFTANPDNRKSIKEGCQPIRQISYYSNNPKNQGAFDATEGSLLPLKIKKLTARCKDGCVEFKDYEFTIPAPDSIPHYIVSLHTKAIESKIRKIFGGENYITYKIKSIEKWMLANVKVVENSIRALLNERGKSQHLHLHFSVWLFPVTYPEQKHIPDNAHEKISVEIMKSELTKDILQEHITNMSSDHDFVKRISSLTNEHYVSICGHNILEFIYLTKPKSYSKENEFRLVIMPHFINKNTGENLFTTDEIEKLKFLGEIKPKNSKVPNFIHEIPQS